MSVSDSDAAFALDLFEPIGGVSGRKMFGGLGLYYDGTIFGLVDQDGQIYLKASGALMQDLLAEGSEQFRSMPYFSLTDSALDDPGALFALTRRCLDALDL